MRPGRRRSFEPRLDSLEERLVLTADPMVHTAIVPTKVAIGTYDDVFTGIDTAFKSFEGSPALDALASVGNLISDAVTNNTDSNSTSGNSTTGSEGDVTALEGRLVTAISKLPGGASLANSLMNEAFASGGLDPNSGPYYHAKLTGLVKGYATQLVHKGEMVLVWPGQAHPSSSGSHRR